MLKIARRGAFSLRGSSFKRSCKVDRAAEQGAGADAEPKATFGGEDLYPGVLSKAATLCFSLVQGHAFVDGNKRIGHAAMAVFLSLNGYTLDATVDDQERLILGIASGTTTRDELVTWLNEHAQSR